MKDRPGQLTPFKVVLIYLIAFCLVSIHEIKPIANKAEDLCRNLETAAPVMRYWGLVRETAANLGLDRLAAAEDWFLDLTLHLPEIGSSKPDRESTSADKPKPAMNLSPPKEAPPVLASIPREKEPEPPEPIEIEPEKLRPKKALIVGDSMILEGLGVAMQREFKKNGGLEVIRKGRYSSGLARPDYFDWTPYLQELTTKHKPDLLIISLGANDPQDILDEKGRRHFVGSKGWNEIYAFRARKLLKVASDKGIPAFWVGLPIMGLKKYGRKIAIINSLVAQECAGIPNCTFVDTWLVLANSEKKYTTYRKTSKGRYLRIRAKDRIHLTEAGGKILTRYFLKYSSQWVEWPWTVKAGLAEASSPSAGYYNAAGELNTRADECRVKLMSFFSKARGREIPYYAFVPRAAQGPQKFPVLYLLHGAWDGYTAWKDQAEGVIRDMSRRYGLIVVTPDGGEFGWYADSALDPAGRIETYFMRELIPHVEKSLPAVMGRRGIAGLSMGGHGALVLALRHPRVFRSVSSMSGIMDITRHAGQWKLDSVFGPQTPENMDVWRQHSALHLSLKRLDYLRALPLLFSVSLGDPWTLTDNRLFHERLTELGIKHEYRESPGNHDWTYWTSALPAHAAFHARVLNGRAAP